MSPVSLLVRLRTFDVLGVQMPQSMTGFANQSVAVGEWNLSLECKSVNSRFLDLTLKLPDVIKRSEPALRQLVSEKLVRGKWNCLSA